MTLYYTKIHFQNNTIDFKKSSNTFRNLIYFRRLVYIYIEQSLKLIVLYTARHKTPSM